LETVMSDGEHRPSYRQDIPIAAIASRITST
jgi:hypothetical protein